MPNKYLDSVGLAEYTTLIKTALDDKADLASPALTGTPTAPTPTAGDNSTKVATTAFVNTKAGNYLPLTGGSITGNLSVSGTITGDVTGTASGNLPLSGGTMTGTLYFDTGGEAIIQNNLSNSDGFIGIYGGAGYTNGAYITLSGKNRSSNAGAFSIYANDGVNGTKSLFGRPDGTLTWAGKDVITAAGGTMGAALNMDNHALNLGASSNDDGRIYNMSNTLRLVGGSNTSTGSYIDIGSASAGTKGVKLVASDGNTTKELTALYNGTLTWAGKNVERVNARGSNSNGDYIRYDNGIQICWGGFANVSVPRTITYPAAFTTAPAIGIDRGTMMCGAWSATGCNITMISGGTSTGQYLKWIAIGTWK